MNDDSPCEDGLTLDADPSTMSTKEWLMRKRKAEYEKAKAAAKVKRQAEKAVAAEQRAAAQAAKDKALWEALQKGDEIDPA